MGFRNRVSAEKKGFARRLRKLATPSEKLLWEYLRRKQLGFRFHRQAVLYGWIIDFWCPGRMLAVELDGITHKGKEDNDARRDAALARYGVRTLRVPSSEVFTDIEGVVAKVRRAMWTL